MIELKLSWDEIKEIVAALSDLRLYVSPSLIGYFKSRKKEASRLEESGSGRRLGNIRMSADELQLIVYSLVGDGRYASPALVYYLEVQEKAGRRRDEEEHVARVKSWGVGV